ncbi:MAG: DMT family transporter [Bacteroidales bacterium]|nr:DMT family transporter [Bacteroidales bacterium]
MIYLILAVLTSTLIIITFRLFERFHISTLQAITVNYLVASAFGYLSFGRQPGFSEITSQPWFLFALIIGVTLIVSFNLFALSARFAGVSVTAISSRMSVIIPVILGFIAFGDTAGWIKITGIVVALVAFYFTSKKDKKVHLNVKYAYLPVFLFAAVGLNDSLMKVAEHYFIHGDFVLFLATAFGVALILGVVVLMIKGKNEKFAFRNVIAGIVLGLLNWYSTLYFLKGISLFQVSFFVPVYNVGVVALASATGFILFTERPTTSKLAGIGLALIAIFLIANG